MKNSSKEKISSSVETELNNTKKKINKVIPNILKKEDAKKDIDTAYILRSAGINFETDRVRGNILIGLENIPRIYKDRIKLEVTFRDGEKQILDGKDEDVQRGARLVIESDKAKQIKSVNMLFE